MKHYEKIKQLVAQMDADTQKFYGGNNAAGTRVRKALQEIKKACNDMRGDVQEVRDSRK
jgi:hypothetical protein